MSEAEIQAAAERLVWETEAVTSGLWLLLPGDRAIEAHRYSAAEHGPLANCWNCKQPTELCSWAATPALGPGDCCTECQHEQAGL